jgi:hypothetical protein
MHVFTLLLACLAACTSATAAAPPPPRRPADPGALAALARDTAVALGLTVAAARDHLDLVFEPTPVLPRGLTIIRVTERDHGTGLRLVISDEVGGPRTIAAWPL